MPPVSPAAILSASIHPHLSNEADKIRRLTTLSAEIMQDAHIDDTHDIIKLKWKDTSLLELSLFWRFSLFLQLAVGVVNLICGYFFTQTF